MPKALASLMGQALRFVAPFDKDWAKAGPASTASAVGLACKARRATDRFTSRCIHQSLVVRPLVFQSRDEVRQVYLTVWRKLQQKQLLEPMEALIAAVIEIHPEYHALLEDSEAASQNDFTPQQGQTNPFLHMGMHIALREQADSNRPRGMQPLYQKLTARKGQHDAEHAMMECLGQALWQAQRDATEPDQMAYLDCLKKL